MSKVSNILLMLEFLSSGRKYSIKELASKLEVSPRMIRVYKDELEKAGIYLYTIKGPYGGYVLNQEVNILKRDEKIGEIKISDKENFNKVSLAIKEKRKCLIEYYSKEKLITSRVVHPYEMILYDNEWGVVAYCEIRGEIRHFYINRIKHIEILKEFYK